MSTQKPPDDNRPDERYWRTIMDAANDPMFIHDAQTGAILDVNRRALEMYEISRDQLAMLDVGSLSTNQESYTQAEAIKWMHKACTEGPQRFEWRSKSTRSGQIFDSEISMRAERIDGRELIIVSGRDISERKQAEALAKTTLDALSAHIAILDHAGNIISVNRSWKAFALQHGAPLETCSVGINYLAICKAASEDGAEDASCFAAGLRSVLNGDVDFFEMEYPCQTKEILFWFSARVTSFPGGEDFRVAVSHEDITARKNAELALIESQKRYRALYENAPLAYQSLDENGCFKDINPAWLKILGYERKEVIGQWFGDFLHPDYVEQFRKRFPAFKACGSVSDVQFLIRHKNGRYRRIAFEGCAGYHPDGRFKQTYCVFQDITASYEAEAALRKSEQEFRSLADTLPLAIYLGNGEAHACDYINLTFTRLFGYTIDEVPDAAAWFERAYPDETYRNEIFLEWTRRVILAKESESSIEPLETEVTCKDGTLKNILWGYINIGEKGYAYGLDLTESRAAMELIRESERRYSSLITNLPGVVYRCQNDERWTMDFISQGIQPLCGYQPEELLSNRVLSFSDLIHPDDRSYVSEQIQEKIAKREMFDFEYRIVTKEGIEKWVWERGSGVFEGDRLLHIEGVINDVTKRKKTEKILQQRNRELLQFSWLLEKEHNGTVESAASEYPDITALNRNGLILTSVGKQMLESISNDIMDLLDTCVAVYEKNGDYAFGTFVSSWCGTLNNASRRLCQTDDNTQALKCGKWLCHNSCWSISKDALETGEPVDRACVGGLHIYAVPILSGNEVIGAINFGYGNPPTDAETQDELSRQYQMDQVVLRQNAEAYKPRPPYIIEVAKRRLQSSARLIGEIVSRKQIEETALARNKELDRFNQAAVGRELRMIELKKEINALCLQVGVDVAYPLHSALQE
jgi:PAS domain S-box-containing protein